VMDTKLLVRRLKELNDRAIDALRCLKKTRHIVLHYEDLVLNHTVSFFTLSYHIAYADGSSLLGIYIIIRHLLILNGL